ncbi:transposase [Spirosoma sp. BT702]|uniref:Transposase n=1 Tax=Spirosoma profusum TaxID=2771354 RepID=A0A927AVV6_9BACT|nr:transposase [Spirosoma profusum]MBD2705341.1 transposase [Spirosoma profusum]
MNQSQQPKRKYTAEFKADVLRLVANGEPIMAVARKMGISDSLIHAWWKADDKAGPPERGKVDGSKPSTRSRQFTSATTANRNGARDIKKSLSHFQPTNLIQTYRFIQSEETNFTVRALCKLLDVSKSAYYSYRNGSTCSQSNSNLIMTTAIDKIFCRADGAGKLPTLWQPSRAGSPERTACKGWSASSASLDARAELASYSTA